MNDIGRHSRHARALPVCKHVSHPCACASAEPTQGHTDKLINDIGRHSRRANEVPAGEHVYQSCACVSAEPTHTCTDSVKSGVD